MFGALRDLKARTAQHFGRRGTILTVLGALWVLIGVGVILVPLDRFGGPLGFLDHGPFAALMWIIFGLVATASGVLRRSLGNRDEHGFNALFIPVSIWVCAYLWSWIGALVTNGEYGRPNAWLGAVVYSVTLLVIVVVAGWPDPSDETRKLSNGTDG